MSLALLLLLFDNLVPIGSHSGHDFLRVLLDPEDGIIERLHRQTLSLEDTRLPAVGDALFEQHDLQVTDPSAENGHHRRCAGKTAR